MLLFALLVAGHYIADFAMQTAFMATHKGDGLHSEHGLHTLTAHSMHHATLAGLAAFAAGVDGWWWVALAVGLTHAVIDYGKSGMGLFGTHVDQAMHLSVIAIVSVVATAFSW